MTDYKQLCGELVDVLAQYVNLPDAPEAVALLRRARAALAEPEPEGPTDEELVELSQYHSVSYTMSDGKVVYPLQEGSDMRDDVLSFARVVLARWGRPAPQPVPVSERLPGPEDCDAQGRCWHFAPAEGFGAAGWSFYQGSDDDTHWLPAHALPLPNNTSRSNFDG